MTCHEFRDQLHEYLDGTLEADQHAFAHAHLERCADCQVALQQARRLSRAVQHALEHSVAPISLDVQLTNKILASANAQPDAARAQPLAWPWLFGNPWRAFAAAAAVLVIVLAATHFPGPSTGPSPASSHGEPGAYSIDVPLPTETHVFKIENGMVTDAVVTQVAVRRARFSNAPPRSSLAP